jgi:hypothetical protein
MNERWVVMVHASFLRYNASFKLDDSSCRACV